MSRPAFQRSMARFALLAMLALVLLPGIGRMAQPAAAPSGTAASGSAGWLPLGAICTTRGLAYDPAVAAIEAIGFALQADDEGRDPAPHAGDDCDYCTLSAAAAVPAFASPAPPASAGDTMRFPRRDRAATWFYPLGLGSRGPPPTA